MNIVESGGTLQIYGEEIKTYRKLPAETFEVGFNNLTGLYLSRYPALVVDEKVYGSYHEKIRKVLKTYHKLNRNMGVILSGPKGVGKSMFARMLANEGYKEGLPLVIIREPLPNIVGFISSIRQGCMVLFDEFDKAFKEDDDGRDPQEELLTLFDGIDDGRKLFVITCNDTRELNEYFLNRPGRFHYHFVMDVPAENEVREYMEDMLEGDARQWTDQVIAVSRMSPLTYDALRAIAFELNQGYDLAETMADLNLERERELCLKMTVAFSNGMRAETDGPFYLDMIYSHKVIEHCYFDSNTVPDRMLRYVRIRFNSDDITTDATGLHVDRDKVIVEWDDDYKYISDSDDGGNGRSRRKAIEDFIRSCKLSEVVLERMLPDYMDPATMRKFVV